MDKLKKFFRKIENFLVPSPAVGGLVIEDFALRYLELVPSPRGWQPKKEAILRLPGGIVEQGRVKDRNNLVAALWELRRQISAGQEVLNVVLSLSSTSIYVQAFDVPAFARDGLSEAANLNLRMISPIDFDQAYSSWQRIENGIGGNGRVKFLGAFVQKTIIDEMADVLSQANFGIATVEFSSLSLTRCLRQSGLLSLSEPQIIISATSSGANMMITENGSLYFNYFFPWPLSDGVLILDNVIQEIGVGLQQMINFYAGRSTTRIQSVFLITSQMGEDIVQEINKAHPELTVRLVPSAKANSLLGAAERGLVRKEEDREIDLSGPSGFELFREHRILQFAIAWRNILISVTGFILLLFIGSVLFLNQLSAGTVANTFANPADVASALSNLQSQAASFNNLVAANKEARSSVHQYSPLLAKISVLANSLSIQLQRVSFDGLGQAGVISGTAPSQASTLSFRDGLTATGNMTAINLPFSSIVPISGSQVSFTVNFVLNSLN
ncbi:MAG: hypothetical protein M1153_00750 [Patescibacteria group bacterium]|nr:hypothetical protein [Patescibacteria group bacterium]